MNTLARTLPALLVPLITACASQRPTSPPATIALPPTLTPTTQSTAAPSATRAVSTQPDIVRHPAPTPPLIDGFTIPSLRVAASWDIWELTDIVWSPDSRYFAATGIFTVAADNYGVAVYDGSSRAREWFAPGSYSAVAFSPDGASVSAAGMSRVTRFDVQTGSPIEEYRCGGGERIAISPDGALIASADAFRSARGGYTTQIAIARAEDANCVLALDYPGWVRSLAFAPSGAFLTAQFRVAGDETIVTWNVATGSRRCEFPGWPPIYSPDGSFLVVPSIRDWTTELRDPDTCARERVLENQGYPFAFDMDRHLVLEQEGGALRVWDLASQEQVSVMPPLPYQGARLLISPDWRSLLAFVARVYASGTGKLMLLQVSSSGQ